MAEADQGEAVFDGPSDGAMPVMTARNVAIGTFKTGPLSLEAWERRKSHPRSASRSANKLRRPRTTETIHQRSHAFPKSRRIEGERKIEWTQY